MLDMVKLAVRNLSRRRTRTLLKMCIRDSPYVEKQKSEQTDEPDGEEGTIFTDDVQS